jgi:hypothetical protein
MNRYARAHSNTTGWYVVVSILSQILEQKGLTCNYQDYEEPDDSGDDDYGRKKSKIISRKREKVADFEPREVRFTSRRAASPKMISQTRSDRIDQVFDFRVKEGGDALDIKIEVYWEHNVEQLMPYSAIM